MNNIDENNIKFKIIRKPNLEREYSIVEFCRGIIDLQKRMYSFYKDKIPYNLYYNNVEISEIHDLNKDVTFEEEREIILAKVKLIDSVKKMERKLKIFQLIY